jgi:hypothetical protein
MEETKLSAEEIEQVIAQLEKERYGKQMIDLVREDLEFGLSKKQIDLYKSKKLRYEQRREISNAMRQGVPDEVVARFSGGKYTEQQLSIFTSEYMEGFRAEKLFEIMDSTQSGYDMKEACGKVKDKLSQTKEKEEKSEPEQSGTEQSEPDKSQKQNTETKQAVVEPAIGTKEFLDSVKMLVNAFSDTMQMQFERMDKRDEEYRQTHDREAEKILNDRISNLEGELADSRKDLSAASGVVREKEQLIRSLQNDLEDRDKTIRESLSEKEAEIKKLREEMEQMKTNHTEYPQNPVAGTTSVPKPKTGYTGNYATTMVMPDGRQIPIQVERTERKSSGLSALMSKILPKGPAKTLLSRMIEGRYSGEQLSEVVYAYDKKLDEAEVQELLDANLPAEEMHGIINVVAAAKACEGKG